MKHFLLAIMFLSTFASAQSVQCTADQDRALVLSGGGAKGAFEAGAIYHLVVQRHCDFKEISGVSVGALNGAFLAQAERSDDATVSLKNLIAQSEELIAVWGAFKGPKDVFRERPL